MRGSVLPLRERSEFGDRVKELISDGRDDETLQHAADRRYRHRHHHLPFL